MALFCSRNPFFYSLDWGCGGVGGGYSLPVFGRHQSCLNILAQWCAGRCFPSFKVDLLLFPCRRRRIVKESLLQVSHWLLHADLFACWGKRICIRFDTAVCFLTAAQLFHSQFSFAASPHFSGFPPTRPHPSHPPHPPFPPNPSSSFYTKRRVQMSLHLEPGNQCDHEEPAQHADLRKRLSKFYCAYQSALSGRTALMTVSTS